MTEAPGAYEATVSFQEFSDAAREEVRGELFYLNLELGSK